MKFIVVVPVKNGEISILKTLDSIIAAAKKTESSEVLIDIRDGKSNDNTIAVVSYWWRQQKKSSRIKLNLCSENDTGLYHAISKAVTYENDCIFSYLNSGDLYEPDVFSRLEEIFSNGEVKWITGKNQAYNPRTNHKSSSRSIVYRRCFVKFGVYGYLPLFPAIQQESTFWRNELWREINLNEFSKFNYAGDYYLWKNFATNHQLYSSEKALAAFVLHGDHKSQEGTSYRDEMRKSRNKLPIYYIPLLIFDQISLFFNLRFVRQIKYMI